MQPGFRRLLQRFKDNETNLDLKELVEDIKVMETEAPEVADIMKRMLEAEAKAILREKKNGLGSAGLQDVQ